MDAAQWDERYAASDAFWSGRVNPTLVEHVAGLIPGRVLEAGAGEGADAVWLAQGGWSVTALDFSHIGLDRAKAAAEAAGVADRLEFVCANLLTWESRPVFDLVVAHFLHFEPEERAVIYETLRDAVAPGGRLLIVGHDPADIASGLRRPRGENRLITAEQIAQEILDETWNIEVARAEPRSVVADGKEATAYDAVLRAVRSV